jgi:hypothetical protein
MIPNRERCRWARVSGALCGLLPQFARDTTSTIPAAVKKAGNELIMIMSNRTSAVWPTRDHLR